jgi:CRISPR-associated protein Csx10
MEAIVFVVRALSPLLVARPGGDINTIRSYPFIPGSAIRGALLSGLGRVDSAHEWLSGSVRFLNALPAVRLMRENGTMTYLRSLPVPLNWRRPKHGDADRVIVQKLSDQGEPKEPSSSFGEAFFVTQSVAPIGQPEGSLLRSSLAVSVGTRRNRRFGRAMGRHAGTADSGAIFRLVTLDEHQVFAGVVLAQPDAISRLRTHLEPGRRFRIGRARRTQGDVEVVHVERLADWAEAPAPQHVRGRFTLTMLSPGVFRDGWGQDAFEPDLVELATALELPEGTLTRGGAIVRTERVGGFSRVGNLAQAEHQAVAGGSVYEFEIAPGHSGTTALLCRTGLGERRVEGYGRIAVNLQPQTRLSRLERRSSGPPEGEMPAGYDDLASLMSRRLFDQAVNKWANDYAGKWSFADRKPSRTLLARLADAVARAARHSDWQTLIAWRNGLAPRAANGLRDTVVRGPGPSESLWNLIDRFTEVRPADWVALRNRASIGRSAPGVGDEPLRLLALTRVLSHLDLQLRSRSAEE